MEVTGQFLLLIPVITALVSVFKRAGLASKYAPLLAVVLGILGALGLAGPTFLVALSGIVAGLSAVGLYSGTKTTIRG